MLGKRGKGFTIVELMVTVVILVILTTLVVVRLLQTETGGRDRERSIDISAIATGLETFYENGSPDGTLQKGYYPGGLEYQDASDTTPPFSTFLEGVSQSSYEAPDHTIDNSLYSYPTSGTNPDGSYTEAQARSLLADYAYLYHPVRRDDVYCLTYTLCTKYFLYYIKEETNELMTIRSKNQ